MNQSRYPTVIPPYILRRIIDHGSEPQQQKARQTLTHVQTLMAHQPKETAAAHVSAKGKLERDIYDAQNRETLPGELVRREGARLSGRDARFLLESV
ncbi:Extracellular metalloprotease precursor [Cronobacter sakazakii 696]|nr:Extracellular metalloprotease precursor [Cronobacter sakazakii 696]